ncbi:MAG TPA: glycogen-binding domain-containing protein [Gemmatimonadaceae bacterium]
MTDRSPRGADERAVPDDIVERMAAPLRAPVRFGEDFDARVMRDVHAAAASTARAPWWRRGYAVRVTPLTGLALAAGLALFALLGRASAAPRDGDTPTFAAVHPAHDTVYIVRFTLVHPEAHRVTLVGDFNGWSPSATPLVAAQGDSVWAASVTLPAGRHEYAFIVDGERWTIDPYAATVHDDFGTSSSVLRVGSAS